MNKRIGYIILSVFGVFILRHPLKSLIESSPSPDEFFNRNPGLSRPASFGAEKDEARKSGALFPHDYHFKAGESVPLEFVRSLKASEKLKVFFESESKGGLTLDDLRSASGSEFLVASFKFKEVRLRGLTPATLAFLGVPSNSAPKAVKSALAAREEAIRYSVLIEIDPSGALKSAKSLPYPESNHADAEEALFLELDILETLLRKMPRSTSGSATLVERNARGDEGAVRYQIENTGKTRKFTHAEKTDSMDSAKSDPRLKNLVLRILSEQKNEIEWNTELGFPSKQNLSTQVNAFFQTEEIASVSTGFSSVWEKPRKSALSPDVEKLYTIGIDLSKMRRIKEEQLKILSKKDGKNKAQNRMSFQVARNSLRRLNDPAMTEEERAQIFLAYSDGLKRDPALIILAREDLMASAPGSRVLSVIMGSLGFVGTPEAQAALVEAYGRSDLLKEDREKALAELAIPPEVVTPETKAFLKSVYQGSKDVDLSKTASFALGSSISKDGDPATVNFFKREWDLSSGVVGDSSSQEEKKRVLLMAMGNSKSDAFLSQAKEASGSTNEELRNAAANSVRFNSDQAGRDLLFKLLEKDPESSVRSTAARSLAFQPFDLRTKMAGVTCAKSDAAISVRMECLHFLADNVIDPEVRHFFESQMDVEKDPRAREIIAAALRTVQN